MIDAVVSVYGKPYQTACAILTLLKYSGDKIDQIYVVEELEQPHGDGITQILPWFGSRVTHLKPSMHLGIQRTDVSRLDDPNYRTSIRYQSAWERTDKDFLFIFHNDCLFSSDIVGNMLQRLESGTYIGVGMIGQCWNCPAFAARLCDGDRYETYVPSFQEAVELIRQYPSSRTTVENIDTVSPMPLPECRLNEFGCLINISAVRALVAPNGSVLPFGTFSMDIGADWFRALVLRGYRFLNYHDGMHHGWCVEGSGGFAGDTDITFYSSAEETALQYLKKEFPEFINSLLYTN